MSDSGQSGGTPVSIDEMRIRSLLRKDSRYRAAKELVEAAEEITAPAYTPERSAAKVIGATLSGVAKAEALRKKAESLPHNQLKDRISAEREALAAAEGRGSVISGIS